MVVLLMFEYGYEYCLTEFDPNHCLIIVLFIIIGWVCCLIFSIVFFFNEDGTFGLPLVKTQEGDSHIFPNVGDQIEKKTYQRGFNCLLS